MHVSDVVAGVAAALEPDAAVGRAFNVGTGRAVSVLDVAEALAHGLGVDVEPEIRGEYRAGDIRHCFSDISRRPGGARLRAAGRASRTARASSSAWLAEQEARDLVDEATAALQERGLAR